MNTDYTYCSRSAECPRKDCKRNLEPPEGMMLWWLRPEKINLECEDYERKI